MEKDFYINLIYKELKGELDAAEKQQLATFLASGAEQEELYTDIKLSWELSDQTLNLQHLDVEADLQKVKAKMQPKTAKTIPFKKYFLRIAATLLLFSAGTYLFQQISQTSSPDQIVLTAADEHLQFELPDGTSGWLKKGSTLSYKKPFVENRNTELNGSAEFKVQRDENHPFKVLANKAVVEVLGTEFTVNQSKERIVVSVASGKVSLLQNKESVLLNKNEVGYCQTANASPEKKTMNVRNFTYWKNKQFRYDNEPLKVIIEQLELIYGIKIQISRSEMKNCQVAGVFNADNPTKILSSISDKFDLKFTTVAENTFTLNEGICN